MGFQWGEMFAHMGVLAWSVVITLALMSLYSFTIGIERWWSFRRMRRSTLDFLPVASDALKRKDLKGALDSTRQYKHSHLAKVLNGGLHEFINHEQDRHEFDIIQAVERNLERASALTTAELRRGLGVLATVGSTAPFVGLLGTVGGIINTFQTINISGSGGLGAVAGGISEALYMTGIGLFVAIPAVWMFNYFTNRIEYFQVEMTNSASEILDYFMKRIGVGHATKA